jgi:hypothetical protein
MLATSTEAERANGARQSVWRSRSVWAAPAWVVAVFVLCPPRLNIGFVRGDTKDGSFAAALEQGLSSGLHWGSQVVWTYGPYGALNFNIGIEPHILLMTLIVRLLTHAVLLALLAALFWSRKAPVWLWVAAVAAFVVVAAAGPIELDMECVLVAVVASWLAVSPEETLALRWRVVLISLAGIALALASLDKVSDTFDAAGILLVVTVHSVLIRRRVRVVAVAWTSWLAGGMLLWLLAGQSVQDIPAFAHTAVELVGGYASAMASGAASWVTVVAALVVAALLGATVFLTARRRPDLALATALAAVVFFLLFKEGFIRADPVHLDSFVVPGVYLLVVVGAILLTGGATVTPRQRPNAIPQQRDRSPAALAAGTAVAVVTLLIAAAASPQFTPSSFTDRVGGYGGALAAIFSPAQREAVRAQDLTDIAAVYEFPPAILNRVRGGTVDVLPWLNVAPLLYGVPGEQQPVLQSYAAFTPYLDELDATFFEGPNAPDFVAIAYLAIDSRVLQFDEPLVVRALADDYQVDPLSNSAYVLLDRRPRPARPPSTPLGDSCVALGQQVTVPQLPGARVYAHVRVSASPLGIVSGLAYRPDILSIAITTLDRANPLSHKTRTFRFVSGTAADGLLVSGLAADTPGLAQLFSGNVQTGVITSFRITTDSPFQYEHEMCVRFESTAAR